MVKHVVVSINFLNHDFLTMFLHKSSLFNIWYNLSSVIYQGLVTSMLKTILTVSWAKSESMCYQIGGRNVLALWCKNEIKSQLIRFHSRYFWNITFLITILFVVIMRKWQQKIIVIYKFFFTFYKNRMLQLPSLHKLYKILQKKLISQK